MITKRKTIHMGTYTGALTMCGLVGTGAPTRSSILPLKKNEVWCARCKAVIEPSDEDLRREFSK